MAYSFKANLSFGFVFIPITLHNTILNNDISFRLFDKKTKSKVKYKKTCEACDGKEIKNENLIKGYEYESGKFVLLEEEDFEKIKTPKDKNITIEQFINISELDPLYIEKSFYVIPEGASKAYTLLLKAMKEEKKAGIGKTVLGNKETLVLIHAQKNYLVLSTLYYDEEIRSCPAVENKDNITQNELKLAKMLIKEMTAPLKIEKYHDEYKAKVLDMIEKKIKGKKIIAPKMKKEYQIHDLMDALKNSLSQYENRPKRKNNSKSNLS